MWGTSLLLKGRLDWNTRGSYCAIAWLVAPVPVPVPAPAAAVVAAGAGGGGGTVALEVASAAEAAAGEAAAAAESLASVSMMWCPSLLDSRASTRCSISVWCWSSRPPRRSREVNDF